MYCSSCGTRNDDDARFCEKCGADLTGMPRSAGTRLAASPRPSTPSPAIPPTYYPPARPRAWWYPIGVWLILSAFFLFVDASTTRTITWAYWPIGILGIFMVGFPILRLLEETMARRPR